VKVSLGALAWIKKYPGLREFTGAIQDAWNLWRII
jgi:hypothetical protein